MVGRGAVALLDAHWVLAHASRGGRLRRRQEMPPEANPMARLLARLWAERDHGGIVELHLAGGAVILPEEFSPRWSGASHGVFASQAADGSVTLTAVAWETVQKIVVRQLTEVPNDMFT